jgi:hypothetical protein
MEMRQPKRTMLASERASRRHGRWARPRRPSALRAAPWPSCTRRARACGHHSLSRIASLSLCHGSFWARPRPCAAGIQACWRQSRRTTQCLWAPHPWYLENKSVFLLPSLVVPPAWVRRAAWQARRLHAACQECSKTRRRGTFTVNVMAL